MNLHRDWQWDAVGRRWTLPYSNEQKPAAANQMSGPLLAQLDALSEATTSGLLTASVAASGQRFLRALSEHQLYAPYPEMLALWFDETRVNALFMVWRDSTNMRALVVRHHHSIGFATIEVMNGHRDFQVERLPYHPAGLEVLLPLVRAINLPNIRR